MKVLHVCASDLDGGAARAAYRIHRALVEHGPIGIESRMRVLQKLSDDPTVIDGRPAGETALWRRLQPRLANWRYKSFQTDNPTLHSVAWPGTGLGDELNHCDTDVVHLHWLGHGTLSVEEVGRLRRPVVWTLHDQWAFCGAEHYVSPPPAFDERFAEGYTKGNRPSHESGPDCNRRTWQRKRRAWRQPMHIVCPSQWLGDCARRSVLMRGCPITVIPYPIDLQRWAPLEQSVARGVLGLPLDRPLILFGAAGGMADPRKGADLMLEALQSLKARAMGNPKHLELLVFGQSRPAQPPDLGFPAHYTGHLHDDISLRLLYAAADVAVIPSRQENLSNVALEAHACGTPVVAFDIGGLPDIVTHRATGWLAKGFDTQDMAGGIAWVLAEGDRKIALGKAARAKAERLWAPSVIADSYIRQFKEAIQEMSSSADERVGS